MGVMRSVGRWGGNGSPRVDKECRMRSGEVRPQTALPEELSPGNKEKQRHQAGDSGVAKVLSLHRLGDAGEGTVKMKNAEEEGNYGEPGNTRAAGALSSLETRGSFSKTEQAGRKKIRDEVF